MKNKSHYIKKVLRRSDTIPLTYEDERLIVTMFNRVLTYSHHYKRSIIPFILKRVPEYLAESLTRSIENKFRFLDDILSFGEFRFIPLCVKYDLFTSVDIWIKIHGHYLLQKDIKKIKEILPVTNIEYALIKNSIFHKTSSNIRRQFPSENICYFMYEIYMQNPNVEFSANFSLEEFISGLALYCTIRELRDILKVIPRRLVLNIHIRTTICWVPDLIPEILEKCDVNDLTKFKKEMLDLFEKNLIGRNYRLVEKLTTLELSDDNGTKFKVIENVNEIVTRLNLFGYWISHGHYKMLKLFRHLLNVPVILGDSFNKFNTSTLNYLMSQNLITREESLKYCPELGVVTKGQRDILIFIMSNYTRSLGPKKDEKLFRRIYKDISLAKHCPGPLPDDLAAIRRTHRTFHCKLRKFPCDLCFIIHE